MKVAAYSGTRNIYKQLLVAATSLLRHNNMDVIYFFIEDDSFPYRLPKEIQCINISNQSWFKKGQCKNWNDHWGGYMNLSRVIYSQLLPQLDKVLSLDVDTIVTDDISELWEIDLNNYYVAGVRDTPALNKNGLYINAGVLLQNLTNIRNDKRDLQAVFRLNHFKKEYPEQDIINEIYKNKIFELPSEYNSHPLFMNYNPNRKKIIHYAGYRDYFYKEPLVQYYKNICLEEI